MLDVLTVNLQGRARASSAKYSVLVYRDEANDFNRDIAIYKGIEKV